MHGVSEWASERKVYIARAHRSIVIKCYTVMIFYYTAIAYDDALNSIERAARSGKKRSKTEKRFLLYDARSRLEKKWDSCAVIENWRFWRKKKWMNAPSFLFLMTLKEKNSFSKWFNLQNIRTLALPLFNITSIYVSKLFLFKSPRLLVDKIKVCIKSVRVWLLLYSLNTI